MLLKISLVLALCAHPNFADVQKKMIKLQSEYPGAQISMRVDKKAVCYQGQVLTGKEAKLAETLR